MKINRIILGVILGLATSVSYALPISFDFTGSTHLQTEYLEFTESGITLTVTAFKQNGDQEEVAQNAAGLGVCVDPQEDPCDTNTQRQIDSIGPNEELRFAISGLAPGEGLALDALYLNAFSLNPNQDLFRMYIDGTELPGGKIKPLSNPWLITDDFGLLVAYDSFKIRAVDSGNATGNVQAQFRVAGLDTHTVPEPTSLALLGLGLVGMGVARRRKKN